MTKTFSLIKKAQIIDTTKNNQNICILENLTYFAIRESVTVKQLSESITHILAGLEQTSANMNPRTVASFLAGVESLSDKLTTIRDSTAKQNTLKVLTNAAMKYDDLTKKSLPNQSAVSIAQYGARFPEVVQKYLKFATSQDAAQQIGTAARQLQGPIQRAMQQVTQSGNTLAVKPNTQGNPAPQV